MYIVCKLLASLNILSDIDTEITPRPVKDGSPLPITTGEYIVCKLLTSLIILSDIHSKITPRTVKDESPSQLPSSVYCLLTSYFVDYIVRYSYRKHTPHRQGRECPPIYSGQYIFCKLLTSLSILSDIHTKITPRPVNDQSLLPITTGENIVCKLLTLFVKLSDKDAENTPRTVKDESALPITTAQYIVC